MVTRSCGDPVVQVIESSSKEFGRTDFLEKKMFQIAAVMIRVYFHNSFFPPKEHESHFAANLDKTINGPCL